MDIIPKNRIYGDDKLLGWKTKEFIQIKKRVEGYHWTPSTMQPIFKKFFEKNDLDVHFTFVTNGAGNTDVTELKKYLLLGEDLSDELLSKFTTGVCQDSCRIT